MLDNYVMVFLMFFLLIWIVLHITDRRRLINGLFFFISLGALAGIILYLGQVKDFQIIMVLVGFLSLVILLSIPIIYIYITIKMFTTGLELIKREGFSLSHALSFIMGLGIVASSIIAPIMMDRINSKLIRGLIVFFLSSFSYFVAGFIIFITASIIYRFWRYRRDKDYLIVLGSKVIDGRATPLLKGRIDRALKFYKSQSLRGKPPKLIMSGGQGPDELVSEAQAMKDYALEEGIREEDILLEDRSSSTEENLMFSNEIILRDTEKFKAKVLFVTSDYHVFRAGLIAKKLGLDFNGIGAPVKFYFSLSATIREYIGVLYMHKEINIVLLVLLVILNLFNLIV